MIHPTVNLFGDYEIGEETTVGAFCDIGGKVGKRCKIQCHVSIPPLTLVGDDVFLGPGVRVANDKKMDGNLKGYVIGYGSKVGAGAIIIANLGRNSIIGAGSVVTKDVPDGETWVGNPAHNVKHNKCQGCGQYGAYALFCSICLVTYFKK